jgi:hypothetical protein
MLLLIYFIIAFIVLIILECGADDPFKNLLNRIVVSILWGIIVVLLLIVIIPRRIIHGKWLWSE